MVLEVRQINLRWVGCAIVALTFGSGVVSGNVDTNPYATIVDRNPFALKPPPPPPPPPEQSTPPVPMAKVTLTGIVSTFGEPRALFEIIEDAKTAGTPKRPILREGERLGPVEVLAIDVVKNTVRLRNSGVETNVTFEIAKASGPVPGGPGVPGAPPTFTPPPALNIPQPHNPQSPQASAPTVVSPNGSTSGGAGVTLMGNNGTSGALPTSTDNGMRTIPSRPLRTENMTKEQADLLMEVNRLRGNSSGDQQQNPNPAYPRPPSYPRSAPPPVPGR